MKILMVNKFLYPNGGSETYIFELGEQLQKVGHEVQYFGMEHEGRVVGNSAEMYTSNMDFHTGKLQKLLYPFKIIYSREAYKKILVVLNKYAPDIVHLNNFTYQLTPSILYAIRRYEKKSGHSVKIVATVHDPQLVCPNHMLINVKTGRACELCLSGSFGYCTKGNCIHGSKVKSLLGTIESRIYRSLHTYRMIDSIICPSFFMKAKMDANPDLVGRNIMLRNFIPVNPEHEEEKNNKNEKYVLYFGRYSEEKGIRTLLKAVQELPHIPFVFAGSGPYEQNVNAIDNIKNKGFLSGKELTNLIANAQFSLITSECFENCPFTVMESQMLGTPVIGADIGGIPELIRTGIDGELFESGNVEALKEKINLLWNDENMVAKYTAACKEVQYDTVEAYCNKIIQIYC